MFGTGTPISIFILFNFEGLAFYIVYRYTWGCSSAGRVPALHAGGQEFEPLHLHHQVLMVTASTFFAVAGTIDTIVGS